MKKKLFFWTNYYIEHPEIGTTIKIKAEIDAIRVLGYEVVYTAYLEDGVAIYDNNDNQIAYDEIKGRGTLQRKIHKRNALINIARKHLKNNIYTYSLLRLNEFNRQYVHMLKEMHEDSFVMIESLSYFPEMRFTDIKGLRFTDLKKLGYYVILSSIKRQKKKMNTYVDLMLTEGCLDDFYGIPCLEFGMGINVEQFRKHSYSGNKDELNLLMVGCSSIYHGTDRIMKSLIEYYKSNKESYIINLHLVGDLRKSDQQLAKNKYIKGRIILYGKKHGEELEDIYDRCNVALGPLAQYRMKKKDTGLKTKEYFAKGIPYIYSGEEVQIKEEYPYIMKVSDDEELIDLKKIINFYNYIKDERELAENMRDKARETFSWIQIFKKVFKKADELKGAKYDN